MHRALDGSLDDAGALLLQAGRRWRLYSDILKSLKKIDRGGDGRSAEARSCSGFCHAGVRSEPQSLARLLHQVPPTRHPANASRLSPLANGGNDPLSHDLVDYDRLALVVQFLAGSVERFTHDAGGGIVEYASRHEGNDRRHVATPMRTAVPLVSNSLTIAL